MRALADAVGDFIRYWGFRRIHGQIWVAVYLNIDPLSGVELTKKLRVSKALVSPALAELVRYKILLPAGGDGKTKTYKANPEFFTVIRGVLKNREQSLLARAADSFARLQSELKSKGNPQIDERKLETLGQLISGAQVALEFLLNNATQNEFLRFGSSR